MTAFYSSSILRKKHPDQSEKTNQGVNLYAVPPRTILEGLLTLPNAASYIRYQIQNSRTTL